MNERWVIVADGAQASFLMVEERSRAPARGSIRLVEITRLSNPEHTVAGRRDSHKTKSGRDGNKGRQLPHGFIDHRDAHEAEVLRRFASGIAEQATSLVSTGKAASLVVVADRHMLGLLRPKLASMKDAGIRLDELGHDYTWCTAPQVQKRLVENGLLPAHADDLT